MTGLPAWAVGNADWWHEICFFLGGVYFEDQPLPVVEEQK